MDRRQDSPPPATIPPPPSTPCLPYPFSEPRELRVRTFSLPPIFSQFLSPLHPPAPPISPSSLPSSPFSSPPPPLQRGETETVNRLTKPFLWFDVTPADLSALWCVFCSHLRGFASCVTVFAILLSQFSFLFSSNKNIRNGIYASCNRFKQNTNMFFGGFFLFCFVFLIFVLCKLKNKHKDKIEIFFQFIRQVFSARLVFLTQKRTTAARLGPLPTNNTIYMRHGHKWDLATWKGVLTLEKQKRK